VRLYIESEQLRLDFSIRRGKPQLLTSADADLNNYSSACAHCCEGHFLPPVWLLPPEWRKPPCLLLDPATCNFRYASSIGSRTIDVWWGCNLRIPASNFRVGQPTCDKRLKAWHQWTWNELLW